MHIKFNAYIFCIYMHIFCMFVHMYAIEVNLWGKCIAYFCIFLHIFAYFYAYLCIFMLMHILAYNAHQDKYVAYYAYFRNAYLCIVSFAYFCMFYAYMCLWIFAYEWIFVICIDLYILAYKTYILHISFVHILHIFCIFCTAYSCIFWNAFSASWCKLCIYMHILSFLAYVTFTFHSGIVWSKLVMWDFVEDSKPDSRFPGIGGWSLIGGIVLTVCDRTHRSSVGVLRRPRWLLACRVVDIVPSQAVRPPLPETWTIGTKSTRRAATPAMMKPRRESSRPALRLFAGKIAAEATRWWLGCGDDSLKQRGAELILQMHDVVDSAGSLGPCVKCDVTVSVAKYLHNFLAYQHLVKPWQYPSRLRMLLYILASLGSIHRGFVRCSMLSC